MLWKEKNIFFKKRAYRKVIHYGIEEYVVSTDRVVKALRYNEKGDKFLATVKYIDSSNTPQETVINVMNEWVLNTYRERVMKKLMDRAENHHFLLLPPTNTQGTLATIKINEDKVV